MCQMQEQRFSVHAVRQAVRRPRQSLNMAIPIVQGSRNTSMAIVIYQVQDEDCVAATNRCKTRPSVAPVYKPLAGILVYLRRGQLLCPIDLLICGYR